MKTRSTLLLSRLPALALLLAVFLAGCGKKEDPAKVLRVGFFPNITHAQAIIAQQMEAEGKSWYAPRMPAGVTLRWLPFNAGPTAMESLLIESIDVSYVGPNPALNAYVRRGGKDIRQLTGSATGGSALVAQPELALSPVPQAADFKGKKIGTPQYGNTQDVACRVWLVKGGLKVHKTGGEAAIVPMQNPELVQLFGQKDIDAAWTVEPWVSRLVAKGGKIVPVKRDFPDITTLIATCERTLQTQPVLVRAFVKAHGELTDWMNKNPDAALGYLHRGLERLTGTKLDAKLVASAFKNITFTTKVDRASMRAFVDDAFSIGMFETKEKPDLVNFFHEENTEK
ncbi:MAG: ABC transporter substrate-binding protein [Puniceicoccales bacterium]|nr:ABC transporter substrate-binding protein [Puniceicoccales bacterium]